MSNILQGIIPSIKHGHMAAPSLLHRLDRNAKGQVLAFLKTNKEKGKLFTLKAKWKKTQEDRWNKKQYIVNERLTF